VRRAKVRSTIREDLLIDRIRRAIPSVPPGSSAERLLIGIGDDAAVLRPRHADWVVTSDAFLENVHFLPRLHLPDAIGYKALARAASDIAAMGARPRFFFLTLALPRARTGHWLDRFLRGMARAARECRLVLAGGDTSQHDTIAISITILGDVEPGRAVRRDGARPGDRAFVSGTLGAAQLGLELFLRGVGQRPARRWARLLQPHLYPKVRIALGAWLARNALASAMIDTSDGFSTDLARLCRASRVGARIRLDALPGVRVPAALRSRGFDPVSLALHGGEDYELLFAVRPHLAEGVPALRCGARLTCIGEFTRKREIALIHSDGRAERLLPRGWDHFAR
jgi:thiamine-monophosphate kinase